MGSIVSNLLGGGAADGAESTGAESDGPSRVIAFHSQQRWLLHFNELKHTSKLMVIDFTATWCGPCKFMAPAFDAMAAKYTEVEFAKIDVDELGEVAREFGVQAMPTFVLWKQGKEVSRVIGAKKDELEKQINKHREVPKFAA